ncbi:MAG: serine/threonine protein kinase [Myxococcales bacterium]|nr:serine/threonine protein kinase [Myxococcales bacterium]
MASHPQKIGRYAIDSVLGSGGMATVYLAQMTTPSGFSKRVALKVLHPHLVSEKDFLKMFMDEARITAELVHGNIVPVFDSGDVDGYNYIAMEFIDGMDLSSFVKRWKHRHHRPLSSEIVSYLVRQIASGLQYAHTKCDTKGRSLGIVHRDLSPQNILLSRSGEVKVADFGIALARNRMTVSEVGVLKGKRRYMSPEQLAGKALDGRSDLYSFALMVYELLVGEGPLSGRDGFSDWIPPAAAKEKLSRGLLRFFRTALSADPGKRFQTAEEFREAFREATGREEREYAALDLLAEIETLAAIAASDIDEGDSEFPSAASDLATRNRSEAKPITKSKRQRAARATSRAKRSKSSTALRRTRAESTSGSRIAQSLASQRPLRRTERGARRVMWVLAVTIVAAIVCVVLFHRPQTGPLQPRPGSLRITSDWPVEVLLDDKPLGSTPLRRDVPRGNYRITFIDRATGWQRVIRRRVNEGKTTAIHISAR